MKKVFINISVIILLVMVFLSYRKFSIYANFSSQVEKTYEAMNHISNLYAHVNTRMNLIRGYAIALDSTLIGRVNYETYAIQLEKSNLSTLLGEYPMQMNQIRKLDSLLDLQAKVQIRMLQAVDNQEEHALIVKQMKISGAYADQISSILDVLKSEQHEIFVNFMTEKKKAADRIPFLILILGIFALLLLSYAFLLTRNELSARMAAQQRLEANLDELNRANKELERFAFIASHNLKEPLRKSQTFLSKVLDAQDLPIKHKEALDKTKLTIQWLQTMMDDLLTYTRLLHQKDAPKMVDLNKLLIGVIHAKYKKEDLDFQIDKLPQIYGIEQQMILLFDHLFSNAYKYKQPEKHLSIKISSGYLPETKTHTIFVQDNGMGFDMVYQHKIFEVFERLHAQGKYSGTGIGLAICRRVMDNHNGKINARSHPNEGTCIDLFFPEV